VVLVQTVHGWEEVVMVKLALYWVVVVLMTYQVVVVKVIQVLG
jgi:hypothetical protein